MDVKVNRRHAGLLAGLGAASLLTTLTTPARAVDDNRDLLDIDPKAFSRPLVVDNKWMPLKPGMRLQYDGSTIDEGRRIPHRVVITVTDMVKEINGIPTVVIHEQDFSRGRLEENELTFFAQDDGGNVWHLGQIVEAYEENDDFIGAQAWMVGHLKGAKAGISMKGDPRVGTPSYSQGFAPAPFNWTDRGQVRSLTERTTVPAGTYDPVLMTEEFDQSYPNASQLKYYAQGIGCIRVGFEGNDPKGEILELTRIMQLNSEQMVQSRADVAALEERAYIYASTKPAARRPE